MVTSPRDCSCNGRHRAMTHLIDGAPPRGEGRASGGRASGSSGRPLRAERWNTQTSSETFWYPACRRASSCRARRCSSVLTRAYPICMPTPREFGIPVVFSPNNSNQFLKLDKDPTHRVTNPGGNTSRRRIEHDGKNGFGKTDGFSNAQAPVVLSTSCSLVIAAVH